MSDPKPPTSVEDLYLRYLAGERSFERASLDYGNLSSADLTGVNLTHAHLMGACLLGTHLTGANLTRVYLLGANMFRAKLIRANLTQADLTGANLTEADLTGANLDGTCLGATVLAGLDLAPFCEARSKIVHKRPSTVDHTSILRSIRASGLKEFLAQTGMPEVFVEYMVDSALSLKTDVLKMLRSTFISYGAPDEAFARKLYEALHRAGA